MSYVRTFLPWIVFAVIPSAQWQWGALAALVAAVAVAFQQRREGAGFDALIIEIGSAVFFAALAGIAFADPQSAVHGYSAALSSGVLALVAAVSLLIRKPFTLGIAKRTTPREVWGLRPFVRANTVITGVWTAAFALTAGALALLAHAGQGHSTAATAVQAAGFVLPMLFTSRYVASLQAGAAAGR
ncbi:MULTISPECIES: hypothetical protein [Streptomyces]|uniref:Uncharacterized protein n=1 Tax=Streptomyces katrae TaxID=68223 RepID=A0A0F4J7S7_9ACTN|nr:hypothetical protein [Streptomyces katrae]KJY29854.1 hypothetical protein VR44_21825 [Streptomyces katrae]MCF3178503.1 hypothetical protein [Streptomyces polychromogenes]